MSFLNKNIKKRSVFLPLLNSVENDIDKNTNIEISYDYLISNNNSHKFEIKLGIANTTPSNTLIRIKKLLILEEFFMFENDLKK